MAGVVRHRQRAHLDQRTAAKSTVGSVERSGPAYLAVGGAGDDGGVIRPWQRARLEDVVAVPTAVLELLLACMHACTAGFPSAQVQGHQPIGSSALHVTLCLQSMASVASQSSTMENGSPVSQSQWITCAAECQSFAMMLVAECCAAPCCDRNVCMMRKIC